MRVHNLVATRLNLVARREHRVILFARQDVYSVHIRLGYTSVILDCVVRSWALRLILHLELVVILVIGSCRGPWLILLKRLYIYNK